MEDLDHAGGHAGVDLLADQRVRHRIRAWRNLMVAAVNDGVATSETLLSQRCDLWSEGARPDAVRTDTPPMCWLSASARGTSQPTKEVKLACVR
jgi:hypothetical protein